MTEIEWAIRYPLGANPRVNLAFDREDALRRAQAWNSRHDLSEQVEVVRRLVTHWENVAGIDPPAPTATTAPQ